MKISTKTGLINSVAFLCISLFAVLFFQVSTKNIIINSQTEDIQKSIEHLLSREQQTLRQPGGRGRNYMDNRYVYISEQIYFAELSGDTLNIIQDPFGLEDGFQLGIFNSGGLYFLGIEVVFNGKTYLGAGDITAEYTSIERFRTISFILIAIFIAVSVLLGVVTTRISLKPWKRFLKIIGNINTSQLGKRFTVEGSEDEIKEMETSLNQMLERLERGFENQRRFSSDAAHELRTPVTSIKGYAQILKSWGLSDKTVTEESVDAILETTQEMQDMIERLLTLSRLETQNPETEVFSTDEWMSRLKKSLIRKHPERKIVFQEESFVNQIKASQPYLDILIGIFVDNAHKFSEKGKEIILHFNKNQIIIQDFGTGIKSQEKERIFERFYKTDASRARSDQVSHGIGLSIAKEIAQIYAIQIDVDSKEQVGTKIILTFDNLKSR
ncbi:MAG: HAMP domain-containing sensor histidine kinase [Thermotogota bacterium]|nr:HAMP domain-containing sensor histidine kinase [Thermotogota bacterium]